MLWVKTQVLQNFATSDFAVKDRIDFKDLKQLQRHHMNQLIIIG